MAAKFSYGTEGIEYYRTGRSLPLSGPRSGEPARFHPLGNRINPHGAVNDLENDKDKGRRRIAVACSRCRKRKIKCSGDIGNGQGCLNCKNAGTDPVFCQFLRVQSYNADCLTTTGDYRYRDSLSHLNVLPTVSPGSMNSLNAYSVSGTVASMPTAQMSRYSMSASNPLLGSEYYGYGGNEGSFEPYHLQSSPQEVTSSPTMYANTDQLRQWGPSVLQPGRGGITVYEENANAKTMHGLPSYIPVASPAVEGQSMFPGMSAMANSLPNSAGGDRVLPTPRLNYMSSNSSDPSMLAASQNYNTENSIPMKNDATWVDRGESLSMPARTESTAIATTQRPSLTRLDSRDGSAAYINNNQQLPAISAPQHQQRSETAASASEYSLAAATNAVSASTDEQQHNLSSPSYATSSYAYSLPSTSSRRPSGSGPSEATLLSGQTYTHLPHRPAPDPPLPRHHQYLGGFHNRGLGPVGANEVRNAASASAASSSRAPLGSVGSSYS